MTKLGTKHSPNYKWQNDLIASNKTELGPKNSDTLVFSIALNGYHWLYPEHLASHHNYANKHNYDHLLITQPFISKLGMECCWLKMTVLKAALLQGYKNVMFIDADAMINPHCPPISAVFKHDKYLYMAHGYTKRFNSGVMIARQSALLIHWLDKVINARFQPLPMIDSTGWGENGHIIYFSKQVDFIEQLDHRWNNTFDLKKIDFIRHFSDGPLRSSWYKRAAHYALRRMSSVYAKYARKRGQKNASQFDVLEFETTKILANYS